MSSPRILHTYDPPNCYHLPIFTSLPLHHSSHISLGPYVIAVTCAVWIISNLEHIYSQCFEHKMCDLFSVFSDCSSPSSSRVCASVKWETSENPQCCHQYNGEVWHRSLAGISFLVKMSNITIYIQWLLPFLAGLHSSRFLLLASSKEWGQYFWNFWHIIFEIVELFHFLQKLRSVNKI